MTDKKRLKKILSPRTCKHCSKYETLLPSVILCNHFALDITLGTNANRVVRHSDTCKNWEWKDD